MSIEVAIGAEIVPLRQSDARLLEVRDLMVLGKWSGAECARLAKDWGVHLGTVQRYADSAASFLRIQNEPTALLETAIAELRIIAMAQAEDSPAVSVAAWRVILEQIERLAEISSRRAEQEAQRIGDAGIVSALRNPPPKLRAAMIEAWGFVPSRQVVET